MRGLWIRRAAILRQNHQPAQEMTAQLQRRLLCVFCGSDFSRTSCCSAKAEPTMEAEDRSSPPSLLSPSSPAERNESPRGSPGARGVKIKISHRDHRVHRVGLSIAFITASLLSLPSPSSPRGEKNLHGDHGVHGVKRMSSPTLQSAPVCSGRVRL